MKYYSTRDAAVRMDAAEAIKMGLSRDGGLLTPCGIPQIDRAFLESLVNVRYQERAAKVMGLYLTDYTYEELSGFAENAYGPEKFDCDAVAPVRTVDETTHCLELWHGPTSAFKDMALQMLPQLLSAALRKTGESKTVCILVATSGDTGKAAMEGFADVPQTKILVFYPKDGVSKVQETQMVTQDGANVGVCAVEGNFDDAQAGVKRIFSDEAIRGHPGGPGLLPVLRQLHQLGPHPAPGGLLYLRLLRPGPGRKLSMGDKVNFCVPTGNFGDILAAYYAKRMGLPVGKLICASNCNDVLTDFLRTGVYDKNRPFHTTMSPSMDILVSSNLERLLFDLSGENDAEVKGYMDALAKTGKYEVSDAIKAALADQFWGGFCGEAGTSAAIAKYYKENGYLIDTHTAVAASVMEQYRKATGDKTVTVFVSTASPYKFCDHVLRAIGETPAGDGVELLDQLHETTGTAIPRRLAALKGKARRFDLTCEKPGMDSVVLEFLKYIALQQSNAGNGLMRQTVNLLPLDFGNPKEGRRLLREAFEPGICPIGAAVLCFGNFLPGCQRADSLPDPGRPVPGDGHSLLDQKHPADHRNRAAGQRRHPVGLKPPLPILRPWVCHAMVAEGGKALL
ncbi:pyridoxal-phosphate dependent enzyme [Oscillibacter sp.]|uniref:pyridoxal-phosphate dependent enzyme n=1 Tax=Oscillibacter sp. TaxID=1945593 RepID=UPI00257D27C9|nr:pyridoxal-phosphate dependent enzyme [Oscillibacter sp.]